MNSVGDRRFAGVEALLDDYVSRGKSAGMLSLISRDGQILHRYCHGHADIESGRPLREDSLFRIYSMTKPMTSVALLQLMEQGHFELDDAAKRWLPALGKLEVYDGQRLESDITFRQLLTHTAGFSYGLTPEGHPVDERYAEVWRGGIHHLTLEQLMATLLEFPLVAQPGSQWHYSIATDICGYLVERIADRPFGDYLRERILEPLGMRDTDFEVPADKVDRFTTLYGEIGEDSLAPLESPHNSPFVPACSGIPVRLHSGGGGLVSTAGDYWRFAQAMLAGGELDGQRIIGADTVRLMTRNHLPEALLPLSFNGIVKEDYRGYGFGLGYCINIDPDRTAAAGSLGDYGWGGMADTYCWVDPAERLVGILMQQYLPSLRHPGRREFRNAVYAALRN